MAGTKEIKRRIKSIRNTKKITKAMELVAASKMKRAVSSTLASRLYAEYSWELLNSIGKGLNEISHPFFEEQKDGKTLLVVITSNRGLCGAYNAQIIKKSVSLIKNHQSEIDVVTVGKKGDAAMRRLGMNVIASFADLPANITLRDVLPISRLITEEYAKKNISGTDKARLYKRVMVAYTDYVSALTQKANIRQVLPVSRSELKELIENLEHIGHKKEEPKPDTKTDYLLEGDKIKLVGLLAEKLTRMQIYQMILESNASEQSARMMAMKNATEASGEMIEDLTLAFNKARQANITREISEISAGMASVT